MANLRLASINQSVNQSINKLGNEFIAKSVECLPRMHETWVKSSVLQKTRSGGSYL